jgi:hypothetical protein
VLLRPDGADVIAIGQSSHAWISGQLARAWGNDRFDAPRPREEVCLGAEQHDVGMAEWDLAPELNEQTGLPYSFTEMPLERHMELWSKAPRRVLSQSRYAALLVSLHGTTLYRRRDLSKMIGSDAAAVRKYLGAQEAFQAGLIGTLSGEPHADEASIDRNRRFVFAWDHLSLALCLDWAPDTVETPDAALDLRRAGKAHTLDPWPFSSDRVEVQCDGRVLRGRYNDEAEMRRALDEAPWTSLRFELRVS